MNNQIDRVSEQQADLVTLSVGLQSGEVVKSVGLQTNPVDLSITTNLKSIEIKNVPLRAIAGDNKIRKRFKNSITD